MVTRASPNEQFRNPERVDAALMFFYIHLETPSGRQPAFASLEFDDLESAYIDACASLPDLARELLKGGRDPSLCELTICSMQNEVLMTVQFSDVIRDEVQSTPRLRTNQERTLSIIDQIKKTDLKAQIARKALTDTFNDSRIIIAESRRLLSKIHCR
jgi:hypothetical protein